MCYLPLISKNKKPRERFFVEKIYKLFCLSYTDCMITQELLGYIKQQLALGISREQISQVLQSNGWTTTDVGEAFAHITPAQPIVAASLNRPVIQPTQPIIQSAQPQVQQPVQQPTWTQPAQPQQRPVTQYQMPAMQSQPVQYPTHTPVQMAAATMVGTHSFKNPSIGMAFGVAFLATIISAGATFLLQREALAMLGNSMGSIGSLGPLFLIPLLFIALLFWGVIFNLVTAICRVQNRSYAKSVVFVSLQTVLGIILGLGTMVGIPGLATFIAGIVLGIVIFKLYYEVTILKSLWVFIVNILLSLILAVALFFALMAAGFGIASLLMGGLSGKLFTNPYQTPMNYEMSFSENNDIPPDPILGDMTMEPQDPAPLTVTSDNITQVKAVFPLGFPFTSEITNAGIATVGSKTSYSIVFLSPVSSTATKTNLSQFLQANGYTIETHWETNTTGPWTLIAKYQPSAGFLQTMIITVDQKGAKTEVRAMLSK